ncbi:MAG TPA: hypothetical protein VFC71_05850 [Candidatus Polarisedimenticolia bacterium]|nr:hypothetical protein [Candidatus Polarisedimenticolia bacterium]
MTANHDLERRVADYYANESPQRAPDRVLVDALNTIESIPQRRVLALVPWRFRPMNMYAKLAIAAAAVVVVAIVGYNLLPGRGDVGGPSPSPTQTPVPIVLANVGHLLQKDTTYRVGIPYDLPFTIRFPEAYQLHRLEIGEVQFESVTVGNGAVTVDLVDGVFSDPCHTEGGPQKAPDLPMTVDGVVDALTNLVDFDAGPVTDATIGGRTGKAVTISNSIDTETAACSGGPMLPLWTFRSNPEGSATNGGTTQYLWVLDVDGTVVIVAGEAAQVGDLEPVIKAIVFE